MTNHNLEQRVAKLERQARYFNTVLQYMQTPFSDSDALASARQALEDEAAALIPDNRVDGNGIRIADLEAVEGEYGNPDDSFDDQSAADVNGRSR